MIKFIENKEENGIDIDWRAVRRIYDSLKVPLDYQSNPWNAVKNGCKYMITLSARSLGKTTDRLLLGLCASKWSDWRITVCYVRPTEDELAQSHAEKLVEVLNTYDNGRYITELTAGEYNCLVWHWKQFFFARRDENGKIEERAERAVIQCLSVDRANVYKSTLNLPYGDIIIYDEFIGQRYRPDECIRFFDLTKTIIRSRLSPVIFMCANTISVTSQYFEELEISKDIKRLRNGEHRELTTAHGTRIYVEILDGRAAQKQKSVINSLFYGFKNPKLASITGGELFAFDSVPHILPKTEDRRVIQNNMYIDTVGELLQVEFVYNDVQGYHLEVHRATRTYDDSIILSAEYNADVRYRFGFGNNIIEDILTDSVKKQNIFFSSNEVGAIFYDYFNRVYIARRKI